jgi:uncharacterized membrane protein HdeD (DUF308 family)
MRAALAALFGVAAIVWPNLTLLGLTTLFGAYALSDGVLALMLAWQVKGHRGFGSLLIEAVIRAGLGIAAFAAPGAVALALLDVTAVWTVASGATALLAAAALRPDMSGEGPLPVFGTLSVLVGVLLLWGPRPIDPASVVGPFALLFAFTILVLALRFRQLAQEIAASSSAS